MENDKTLPSGQTTKEKSVAGQPPNEPASQAKSPPGESDKKQAPAGTSKGNRGWLWLLILLLLVGAGFGLWHYYGLNLNKLLGELNSQSAVDAQQVEETSAQLSALEVQIDSRLGEEQQSREALATSLTNQLAEMQLSLTAVTERLRELSTTSREDWLLAEAEYLLRLASQRLYTERQTRNALELMISADQIISGLDDPDLFAVRKALADDITRLRMAGVVDREGIYVRLDALIQGIETLSLPMPRSAPEPEAQQISQPAGNWYQQLWSNMKSAAGNLVGLVRIQRRDKPLEPLLTIEESVIVGHNLRVLLEQAQLALLREEPAIYQSSLQKAQVWVADHFEENSAAEVFQATLNELAAEEVVQPLPSISPSLKALQNYIRLWHSRYDHEAARVEQEEGQQ